jgi:hypothetical protein
MISMAFLITLPFLAQALIIFIDEFYFHVRRGLPKWERIGHPFDTLSLLICILFVLFVPFSPSMIKYYALLALFSSLFVTKDEFVHKKYCPASEQWLHALLFLNHPIVLTALGLLWPVIQNASSPAWLSSWLTMPKFLYGFVMSQALLATFFFLYQVIYWNFIWKDA